MDFDFEKFCSVSLKNLNVYACLVCGKYYQGRGPKSHAYTHSLEAGHHVYINLRTEKVYCLPDGYEIVDPSLDDIRHVLNPRYSTIGSLCIFFYLIFLLHYRDFLVLCFYNLVVVLTCRFTREQVEQIDKSKQWSRALDGSDYLPGMVFSPFVSLIIIYSKIYASFT